MPSHFVPNPLLVGFVLAASAAVVGCSSSSESASGTTGTEEAKDAGANKNASDSGAGKGTSSGDAATSSNDRDAASADDTDAGGNTDPNTDGGANTNSGNDAGTNVPAAAAAAGFTKLIFDDEFDDASSITFTKSPTFASPSVKWAPNFWNGSTSTSAVTVSNGVASVTSTNMGSVPSYMGAKAATFTFPYGVTVAAANSSNTVVDTMTGVDVAADSSGTPIFATNPPTGSFYHVYFEASLHPISVGGSSDPCFWSWGVNQFLEGASTNPTIGDYVSENDFIEFYGGNSTVNGTALTYNPIQTLHSWIPGKSPDFTDTNNQNFMQDEYAVDSSSELTASTTSTSLGSALADTQNFHTWGVLWAQTSDVAGFSGFIEHYFDGELVSHYDGKYLITRYLTGIQAFVKGTLPSSGYPTGAKATCTPVGASASGTLYSFSGGCSAKDVIGTTVPNTLINGNTMTNTETITIGGTTYNDVYVTFNVQEIDDEYMILAGVDVDWVHVWTCGGSSCVRPML